MYQIQNIVEHRVKTERHATSKYAAIIIYLK